MTDTNLIIWQQNVNKSPTCQHDLISNAILANTGISIIALQEPAINAFNKTIASKEWIATYPTTHEIHPEKTRSITLIRSTLSTDTWEQINFPSGDVTVTQLKGKWGKLTIFNIYNECEKNNTIKALSEFHKNHSRMLEESDTGQAHVIWLGDFNRHHPYWDDLKDTRLFNTKALIAAEKLIEAVADAGLELALPSGIPTHVHHVTKKWTRLDQVFLSEHSTEMLISCNTQVKYRGVKTDHLPIVTELELAIPATQEQSIKNFREVDWEEFNCVLEKNLRPLGLPS